MKVSVEIFDGWPYQSNIASDAPGTSATFMTANMCVVT